MSALAAEPVVQAAPARTDPPIRVLFTIPNVDSAGSGWVMTNLIEQLDPQRFHATVCMNRLGGYLEGVLRERGVEILVQPTTVKLDPKATLPSRLRQAAAPFHDHHFDLWHSYNYTDDFTEPLIARLAGARAWVYTKKNMGWTGRGWQLRSLLSTRIAAMNTVMTNEYFAGPMLRGRTSLIPPGIVPEQWVLDPAEGRALRDRLGLAHDAFVVGCSGSVTVRKGQTVLARSLADLPDVHVIQVGRTLQPEYEQEVRDILAEVGATDRFHWLDHAPHIQSVLAASDVFCLPTVLQSSFNSRVRLGAEGCPVGLLEAMAAGVASVATDVPGAPDVIQHGVSGLLVPPDDPAALAGAFATLFADPERRRAIAEAGERRMQRYTVAREAAAYEALYAEALRTSLSGWIGRSRR